MKAITIMTQIVCCMLFAGFLEAPPPGLKNCKNTCFLNASVQMLYSIEPLRTLFTSNEFLTTQFVAYFIELLKLMNDQRGGVILCTEANQNTVLYKFDMAAYDFLQAPTCSQQDAADFLAQFFVELNKNVPNTLHSYFINLFNAPLLSRVACLKSKNTGLLSDMSFDKNEPISILTVPMFNYETNTVAKTLTECLDAFFKKENLMGENKYISGLYGPLEDCTKQLFLKDSPDYLMISLNRFKYELLKGVRTKLNNRVYVPFFLNIAKYIIPKANVVDHHFKLHAAIVQGGGADSGHYWAYVCEEENSSTEWFKCDDSLVTKVKLEDKSILNFNDIHGGSANTGYFFVYKKIKLDSELSYKIWREEEDAREGKPRATKPLKPTPKPVPKKDVLVEALDELKSALELLQVELVSQV